MEERTPHTTHCPRCSWWILPLACAHHSPTSSARAYIQRRRGCPTVVSSARETSEEGSHRRRRSGAHRSRERRTRHGLGPCCPSCLQPARYSRSGCVMSDGRFAVLGGETSPISDPLSLCEVLTLGDNTHWEPLPPMRDARRDFACAAMAGCIIVAGGRNRQSTEVFDEVLGQWLRLPHDLPHVSRMGISGALL